MRLPRGVVLDMDDTLFREYDFVMSGYAAVARVLRIEGVSSAELFSRLKEIFDSEDRPRAFNALLEPLGRPDLIGEAVEIYRRHTPSIHLLPEAVGLLDRLRDAHMLAIVTDGPGVMQRQKAAALGVSEWVKAIVFSDEIAGKASWKPSPAPYLAAARELGLSPEQCVYIGDNPHKDFLGARNAGMSSIRVRTAWQLHGQCEASDGAKPDGEVPSLALLP